jgi:hypothetical protein
VTKATTSGDMDAGDQPTTTQVDAHGRTVAVWNADNVPNLTAANWQTTTPASITFKLDGFGRMRETDLKGQTQFITATYDSLGHQTSLNDPDKGNCSYISSALGQKNTESGYSYNLDTGKSGKTGAQVEPAHVDVNRPNPKPKDLPPKKKLPINGDEN